MIDQILAPLIMHLDRAAQEIRAEGKESYDAIKGKMDTQNALLTQILRELKKMNGE